LKSLGELIMSLRLDCILHFCSVLISFTSTIPQDK
jgi:hypothetical protein